MGGKLTSAAFDPNEIEKILGSIEIPNGTNITAIYSSPYQGDQAAIVKLSSLVEGKLSCVALGVSFVPKKSESGKIIWRGRYHAELNGVEFDCSPETRIFASSKMKAAPGFTPQQIGELANTVPLPRKAKIKAIYYTKNSDAKIETLTWNNHGSQDCTATGFSFEQFKSNEGKVIWPVQVQAVQNHNAYECN